MAENGAGLQAGKKWAGAPITGFDSILLLCTIAETMNVSLTPELEKFVQTEVNSGLYQTASEVIRAGLRRLKEDQETRNRNVPATREELEAHLLHSIESLDRGEGVDGEEVFRRLAKRIKKARAVG
jgi:antitoxin ParD1/3/4